MKELDRFARWITANTEFVFGAIWVISIAFGIYMVYKHYYDDTEDRGIGQLIYALFAGFFVGFLLHVVLVFAFAVPYFILGIVVKHEEILSLLSAYVKQVPPEKWKQYYEYATYLATIAGLIQLAGYAKTLLFGADKK
ncbi:MAG TPA: hypothetical protein PLF25_09765 [Accumulibacter sp.]|jgi:hypothetical protein|nr:hypothetical protein [Accumulibacter sp.]